MKIEIDSADFESLNEKIKDQKETIDYLNKQLRELNIDELEDKAIKLSKKLFDQYMQKTFECLGFEGHFNGIVSWPYTRTKKWWEEDVEMKLEVHIINGFKNAFLKIGVLAEEQEQQENLLESAE